MAVGTAYYSTNMETAQVWNGYVTAKTSTHIQIAYGGYVQNYYGSGFTYNAYTVTGGVVTSTDYYEFGQKIYEISGGPYSAATVASYIDSGNIKGLFAYIFSGADTLNGSFQNDAINGYGGNDTIYGNGGNDAIDGGSGFDTAVYGGNLASYMLNGGASGHFVYDKSGGSGTDTLVNVEQAKFTDMTVNLTVQAQAAAAPQADVQRLNELYIAFFNRVPDADGLSYWISQKAAGQSINQIAESFYNAGVQYPGLTGFSPSMSNAEFVNVVYRNVLGRADGADSGGLVYWTAELASGRASHGSLVSTILDSAHTFKGDPTWGWVANLLDNKIAVAHTFAVDWGLNYNTPEDSISHGMAIAAAITPTSIDAAINLIGISDADINLG